MWLHLFARLVAAATLLLIAAGGMVTSTGSGLAVPDWPTSYGYFMFSFPLSYMVGGIFYEHGHRLIASVVGLLTIVLALWLWASESRQWVRRLGLLALAVVIIQGLLGGITVLFFLPTAISVSHAGLAQVFFCLTVSLATFTSPGWRRAYRPMHRQPPEERPDDPALRRLTVAVTTAIYLQILIGAAMRHTGAGLAIPDFPLVFGGLIPPEWTWAIGIHYGHRVGALVVALMSAAAAGHVWHHHRARGELRRPALLLIVLLAVQIALGAFTILSGRHVLINTSHVAAGALLLVTSLVLTLRVHRGRFADLPEPVGDAPRPTERSRYAGAQA